MVREIATAIRKDATQTKTAYPGSSQNGREADSDLAVRILEAGRAVKPNDPYLLSALGAAYRYANRLSDAEQAYTASRQITDSRAARTGLGAVYRNQGRYDDGAELAKSVLREDRADVYAWNRRRKPSRRNPQRPGAR